MFKSQGESEWSLRLLALGLDFDYVVSEQLMGYLSRSNRNTNIELSCNPPKALSPVLARDRSSIVPIR